MFDFEKDMPIRVMYYKNSIPIDSFYVEYGHTNRGLKRIATNRKPKESDMIVIDSPFSCCSFISKKYNNSKWSDFWQKY